MKFISALVRFPAIALCTILSLGFVVSGAHAGEYCSVNTSGMRGCGFSSLEQCKASLSGTSGTCMRDPFYENNAMAYQGKQTHKLRPTTN